MQIKIRGIIEANVLSKIVLCIINLKGLYYRISYYLIRDRCILNKFMLGSIYISLFCLIITDTDINYNYKLVCGNLSVQ